MNNKQRVILHSDINHCYAQIEEMKCPELRKVPMAVGGSQEKRHGIILAKNDIAKTFNIKTAESLVEARKKCKDLLIIHPNYEDYIYYTNKVKNIYRRYSNQVESYGLDEAWIDVTSSLDLYGTGLEIAKRIQNEVFFELGLTVSIGVSWNKIFAKFGSDLDKKMGLTEITKDNYKALVWTKPVEELFYVGKATKEKLNAISIEKIGQLAQCKRDYLLVVLGKFGGLIHDFANGIDNSYVQFVNYSQQVKSVGNSFTAVRDICNYEEAIAVFYVLAESVASRLRDKNLKAGTISINLRDKKLKNIGTRQKKANTSINTAYEIMELVKKLLRDNYDFKIPLRSIGISASNLVDEQENQLHLNLFPEDDKQLHLEKAIDLIRLKYGYDKIKRTSLLPYGELTDFNPKEDNTIHPESYFH